MYVGAFAAITIMAAYAQTSYTNPIVGGDYPDPSIIRDGDDYYMTHSAFDYVPGLLVLHSKVLVNWEPIGSAVNEYLGSIWAPDISKCGDGKARFTNLKYTRLR